MKKYFKVNKTVDKVLDKVLDVLELVIYILIFITLMILLVLAGIYLLMPNDYINGVITALVIVIPATLYYGGLLYRWDIVEYEEPYEPSRMIGKYFTYDGRRYIIYQYVCNGQDDESCFFKCRLVDVDECIIWHEEELKKAIAVNDVEVEE